MTTLPPADVLVEMVRRDGPDSLNAFLPVIDEYGSTAEIAGWLGVKPTTIRREQYRPRSDGQKWPDPDRRFGRASAWKYRTIVLYRAAQPGPGNRTTRERTV